MGLRNFIFGFLLALSLSACGTFKFIYKYYVYDYEAKVLRGPKPVDDLNDSVCSYSNQEFQCVVMRMEEFYKLKKDHLELLQKIDELQRTCKK